MTKASPTVKSAAELRLHALFVRGLAGDAAAYRMFLQQLASHLRAFLARRLFGWPDDVEDLVQECLLAMHNQRHTYQPDQPLTAWVHAIARYKMIDLLRARAGREALHDPLDDELAVFAESDNEASDARRDLAGLLATLPDRHRLPIVHTKLEGLSVAETARLTGMSESAVKVGVHRGLKALAQKIRETR
ncbi:sigma-70 family RNA polymerase sigma factor [Variovorax saccharolyticus]|uniref:sigma-70 family RNA polymerase sigma factor n=1 Tax=Variovorax saccharolyticus TaxID=3053516 RepID=UPI002577E0BE|nr:sigma-70 family RNA polymerase sigma factor [Variovorax sp. J31P216]MDM0023511.1 sigma-70 family RNA polymerase sigma factor [Variovorax sp. J31P216]